MDDGQWRRIADRIGSTWTGDPALADGYRGDLDHLTPEAVERALDDLLIDYRNAPPPPDVVRRRAEAIPPDELDAPHGEWGGGDDTETPGEAPPADTFTPHPPPHLSRTVEATTESPRATVALILGVAGLVTIPILVPLLAIIQGNRALAEIAGDPTLTGAPRARTGRMLGIIGLLLGASAVVLGAVFAVTV